MQGQAQHTRGATKRLDIQGLRALAVTLVVVFHLFPNRLPGGYIGVDIFFAISGFLITAHLLREVETTGRIRVTEFWAKRVRRLLPASLLVLLVTAILTMTVMPGNTRTQNYGDIGYAAGYILNWRLAANSVDYLNADAPPSLVQHYWSLSIEEQFYLVWPVLIVLALLIAALTKKPARRFILSVLLIVLFASLAFSIFETARSQPSAYFITTTRAWEFAFGGLVAMLPAARFSPALRGILSYISLAAIAATALLFGPTTAFPGSLALIPIAATAILLWCGDTNTPMPWRFAPQRVTHNRVVQFLGDTSYSIYLWHWPLILIVTAILPTFGWGVRRAAVVIPVTLVLAWLTLRFVEDPIRRAPGPLKRQSVTFGLMGLAIAAIIALVTVNTITIQRDVEQRKAEIEALLSNATDTTTSGPLCVGAYAILNDCSDPHKFVEGIIDPTFAQEDSWIDADLTKKYCTEHQVGPLIEKSCFFDSSVKDSLSDSTAKRVVLLGDSHAEHLISPLQQVAAREGWALQTETRPGCGMFGVSRFADQQEEERCVEWTEEHISAIESDPSITSVLIAFRIDFTLGAPDPKPILSRLQAAGKDVILIRDSPMSELFDAQGERMTGPACLAARGAIDDACSWKPVQVGDWLFEGARELNIDVVNLWDVVCPDGRCHMITGDLVVYTDDNHFTGMFTKSLAGWLQRELVPLVK